MSQDGSAAWAPLEQLVPADLFKAEVRAWAERLGVELGELQLRPMKRAWASCSTRGRVTFDTELLAQPAQFRREVIVHELLHLKLRTSHRTRLFKVLLKAHLAEAGSA